MVFLFLVLCHKEQKEKKKKKKTLEFTPGQFLHRPGEKGLPDCLYLVRQDTTIVKPANREVVYAMTISLTSVRKSYIYLDTLKGALFIGDNLAGRIVFGLHFIFWLLKMSRIR